MTATIDPGLQPERTLLAWRRTSLSLAIGVTLAARYALELSAFLAIIGAAGGLAAVALAYVLTARRYRRVRTSFHDPVATLASGGRSVTVLSAMAIIVCAAAAVFVVTEGSVS